ncbi:tRNA threonylcarbamoyladenosine biosynthesis protein TsaE [Mariniphaga anaerophila]|uniref:tRNA threonylcarbamoyladenosine biosynthesis protein TsaE n=1 Tax=Mariniphaga anaerophila TaxID=1484053 RepID=A0A1M5BGV8_9BACT|nr:tRNA (adenosine(37)-N6)-threonylcarbamoyltransferase complex ATPase subunit type 1 TsaE [Mariniphaga anaerophila]SHF41691.1 tRNA threonylcarbamoyladenosine biosynthesis protein TsaE [Mariniphaga anaerophila]
MYSEKVTSIKDLGNAAKKLIAQFPDQRVFAFYGKMGAGKTTFIQAICKALGTSDNVTSPTFALINEYETQNGSSLFHFDFYRIKDIEEAFDMGYEDYFYSNNYCLIEWPEKVEALLPQKYVEVKIDVQENGDRLISAKF